MATALIKRPLLNTTETVTVNLGHGNVREVGDAYYVPLTLDTVTVPDVAATNVSGEIEGMTLTSLTAGAFDNVRVGDILHSFSAGSVPSATATMADCYVVQGTPMVIFPVAFSTGTFPCRPGDAISGTGLASNALVDKIDMASRTIYLSLPNTAEGVATLTVTKKARVTEVRKRTEALNPNQITIDIPLTAAVSNVTAVVASGIKEAIVAVLRINPTDNATGSKLDYAMGVHYPTATSLVPTANGLGFTDPATLAYSRLQGLSLDLDAFMLGLGVPRSTGIAEN
jgi:hypothetical protein